jgi:hypothetical protein
VNASTVIANLALSHLGVGKTIANVETEHSQEAAALRAFYDTARDESLRAFPWPFATRIVALALVEEGPNDEWAYSYRYPSGCLMFRRILSGTRNDSRQSRVPYKISQDDAGLLILTDAAQAEAEYTVREDNIENYPPDFRMALSFLLAFYVAPRLTSGDPLGLGNRAFKLFNSALAQAAAAAANEEQPDEPPDSEMIRSRQ